MREGIVAEKNINRTRYSIPFILLVISMFGVGFTTLYSASIHYGNLLFGEPLYFVFNQLKHFVVAAFVMLIFTFLDFKILRRLLPIALLITLILCIMTFIPGVSESRHGAVRWVTIGRRLSFQPSEFVKFVMIIFFG